MPIRRNAVHKIGDTPVIPSTAPAVKPTVPTTDGPVQTATKVLPGKITRDTPIRSIGSASALVVRGVLEYAKSPAMAEFDALYKVIAPHAIAMLAIMAKETEYGRTANGRHNGWNVLTPSGFVNYASWADGARDAMQRLTVDNFKGVYEPTITVAAFIQTFQGGPRCRTTNYAECANGENKASIELSIRQFLDRANRIQIANANATPDTKPLPKPVGAERAEMVRLAKRQVGKPYIHGTHGPDTFDCSGLVGYVYKMATGRDIGFGSVHQWSLGTPVAKGKEQPGDVFFWDTFGPAPGHNAIYIGNGRIVHALNESAGVVEGDAYPQNIGGNNRFMGIRDFGFRDVVPEPEPEPGPIVFGRVPKPKNYGENIIAPGVNNAFDYLGARKPRGLILHRMLGTLIGTNSYFQGEARNRALTDFGLGLGADGKWNRVIRWTNPGAGIAPWASGPADGIDGDGTAFYAKYRSDPVGVSVFNRDCESIELEGLTFDSTIHPDMYAALVEVVAWRADAWLKIPWNRWPLNNDGVHCLLGHSEVTDQKACAGNAVYVKVTQLINDVRVVLKKYQTGG